MSRVDLFVSSHSVGVSGIRALFEISRSFLLPTILALLVSACAVEGDFGRPRPTAFTKLTDTFLLNADIVTRGLNRPELDRDEIILREAGHALIAPLNLAPQMLDIPLRSSEESYNRRYDQSRPFVLPEAIARELDKDHHALTRFGEAARRVLQTYSQRMDSLLRYDPVLKAKKRQEARTRMQENFDYIDSVFTDFGHRLQAYHYAIGDLRTNEDDPFTAELESSLAHLRDRTAALEYELTHYFGAALARAEFQPPKYASQWDPRGRRSAQSVSVPGNGAYNRAPYGPPPENRPFK